jgi:protease PrsW
MHVLLITVPAAVVPSILLVWYLHYVNILPKPRKPIVLTFVFGVLITIPIVPIEFAYNLISNRISNPILSAASESLLTAAIPEELFKFMVMVLYCLNFFGSTRKIDAIIYGSIASLGYATLENFGYVYEYGLNAAILRAFTAVPAHAILGAVMGSFLFSYSTKGNFKYLWYAFFIPVLLHAGYDFPLMLIDNLHKIGIKGNLATIAVFDIIFLVYLRFAYSYCISTVYKAFRADDVQYVESVAQQLRKDASR